MFVPRFRVGERKYKCSVAAFALGNENTFVRCPLSRWGTKIHLFAPRFCVGERKYKCSLPAFASGRRKYKCSFLAFALGNENTFVRCPLLRRGGQNTNVRSLLLRWGSNKHLFVPRFRAAFSAKPRGILPVTAHFCKKRGAFSSSRRIFRQNARRFPRLGVFSAKTRGVLLVTACFLLKRGTFCSPRCVFCQNANRFPRHEAFSAKTALAGFPLRSFREPQCPVPCVCRAVAPARRGESVYHSDTQTVCLFALFAGQISPYGYENSI